MKGLPGYRAYNSVMFCPECETEYREGFTTCADCGVVLVAELGMNTLVPLTTERSSSVIDGLVDMLERAEVPYVIEAGTALRLLDGEVEELEMPEVWQARIWVTAARVEEAKEILREVRVYLAQQAEELERGKPMFATLWRFTTRTPEEFERHYGPEGTWARLFRQDREFVRTDLLKGPDHYLTLDCWTSRAAYEAFRERHAAEYAEIDRMCESVTTGEEKLGDYEALPA